MSVVLKLFPFWAILFSVLAFFVPSIFVGLKPYIVSLLIVIMMCMGLSLKIEDFKAVYKKKISILVGIGIQFIMMPLLAFVISKIFNLSLELTAGMMLVGTAAGGTASNVMTYLAKGDLALSVLMTSFSTFFSIFLTPFLTWIYLGQKIEVPVINMIFSLIQVILVPISFGVSINYYFKNFKSKIDNYLPLVSMFCIVLIIAIVVALNQQNIQTVGFILLFAVIIHNVLGLASGYFITKYLGYDEKTARTIGIEVGMQNSGLSVVLALKYFSSLSALPGAIFSVWHNISGSILAGYWQSKKDEKS